MADFFPLSLSVFIRVHLWPFFSHIRNQLFRDRSCRAVAAEVAGQAAASLQGLDDRFLDPLGHVALADVPRVLTRASLEATIDLTAKELPRFGVAAPRIAWCARWPKIET